MFNRLWVYVLSLIYRLLIIKVKVLDRARIVNYDKLKVFGEAVIQSNFGPFTFIFKEDRRSMAREKEGVFIRVSSYFVELKCPDSISQEDNIFHQKVILVVKTRLTRTNYQALGKTLLDVYIKAFSK